MAASPDLIERESALQGLGVSRLRKEDARFIRGKGAFIDDLKLSVVHDFERDLLDNFRGPKKDLRQQLAESRSFKDGLQEKFIEALREFKANWQPPTAPA